MIVVLESVLFGKVVLATVVTDDNLDVIGAAVVVVAAVALVEAPLVVVKTVVVVFTAPVVLGTETVAVVVVAG